MVKQPQDKINLDKSLTNKTSKNNSPLEQDHEWNLALKLGKSIVQIKHMLRAKSQANQIELSEPSDILKRHHISPIVKTKPLETDN